MKLTLYFLIITSSSVFAQHSKLDSLENLLAKGQSDTAKINLTFEIAIESWSTAPEKTLENAEKVLAMSKKIGYKKGEADGQYALGVYYWQKNKYPEAIAHYSKSEDISRKIENQVGIGKAIASAGIVYEEQGNYSQALDNYLTALAIFQGLKDQKRSSNILNSIGNVHKNQRNYDEGLSFYRQAQAIWIKLGDKKSLAGSYVNIATIYIKKRDYHTALSSVKKGLKLFDQFKDTNGKIICHNNLGEIYFQTAKYDLAAAEYEQALAINREFQRKPAMVGSYNGLGHVYSRTNQHAKALASYYQAQELAKANGIRPALQLAYEGLASVYGQTGNYANAFRFQKLATDLKDSLFNEESTIQMTNLRVHYENELKEKEIKLLKKERGRGDAARNMIMVGLLVVLIVVAQTSNRQRRKDAKNKELQAAQKALADIEIQNSLEKEQHLTNELQFKNKALTTHTLNLIQKNSILEDIRETVTLALKSGPKDQNTPLFSRLINLIDYSFNLDKDWDEFKAYFEGVHPNFFSTLKGTHPELSAGELRLCALVRLNLNLKESAGLLSISPDSVKTARHRLRKKLKLGEENNLLEYLMRI
ncbi:tetratricopeptide repeat protein [Dyadobacter chenwenxiniae]|uniref:Tetratricopeptide repeat protein n=1 Tax=Dyadobacter chenwenxiniae TaxID=2906456 RepID=A0A9X1TI82_9BACT|nr:tetratricopeptide repeat protein [Dyadobacter chenwenxiniae]MCF0065847.1 tetratricopeptide repeat protein [Dyadobacter chenwenxiniae]UON84093.1 tetratricopeptide repeat protein [Dyadobacter chenwenxiniae]